MLHSGRHSTTTPTLCSIQYQSTVCLGSTWWVAQGDTQLPLLLCAPCNTRVQCVWAVLGGLLRETLNYHSYSVLHAILEYSVFGQYLVGYSGRHSTTTPTLCSIQYQSTVCLGSTWWATQGDTQLPLLLCAPYNTRVQCVWAVLGGILRETLNYHSYSVLHAILEYSVFGQYLVGCSGRHSTTTPTLCSIQYQSTVCLGSTWWATQGDTQLPLLLCAPYNTRVQCVWAVLGGLLRETLNYHSYSVLHTILEYSVFGQYLVGYSERHSTTTPTLCSMQYQSTVCLGSTWWVAQGDTQLPLLLCAPYNTRVQCVWAVLGGLLRETLNYHSYSVLHTILEYSVFGQYLVGYSERHSTTTPTLCSIQYQSTVCLGSTWWVAQGDTQLPLLLCAPCNTRVQCVWAVLGGLLRETLNYHSYSVLHAILEYSVFGQYLVGYSGRHSTTTPTLCSIQYQSTVCLGSTWWATQGDTQLPLLLCAPYNTRVQCVWAVLGGILRETLNYHSYSVLHAILEYSVFGQLGGLLRETLNYHSYSVLHTILEYSVFGQYLVGYSGRHSTTTPTLCSIQYQSTVCLGSTWWATQGDTQLPLLLCAPCNTRVQCVWAAWRVTQGDTQLPLLLCAPCNTRVQCVWAAWRVTQGDTQLPLLLCAPYNTRVQCVWAVLGGLLRETLNYHSYSVLHTILEYSVFGQYLVGYSGRHSTTTPTLCSMQYQSTVCLGSLEGYSGRHSTTTPTLCSMQYQSTVCLGSLEGYSGRHSTTTPTLCSMQYQSTVCLGSLEGYSLYISFTLMILCKVITHILLFLSGTLTIS